MEKQFLEQVTVQMDSLVNGFKIVHYTPCPMIGYNGFGTTSTLAELIDDSSAVTGTLSCIMKYKINHYDPITDQSEEDEETYPDEFIV